MSHFSVAVAITTPRVELRMGIVPVLRDGGVDSATSLVLMVCLESDASRRATVRTVPLALVSTARALVTTDGLGPRVSSLVPRGRSDQTVFFAVDAKMGHNVTGN